MVVVVLDLAVATVAVASFPSVVLTSSADRAHPSPDLFPYRGVVVVGLCPLYYVDRTAVSRTMMSNRARHRRRCAS